ncbi:leukocyte surface antigen CD47-like isoform X3 [Peromyscus maniculatus bairdii]|uniref:leukocyte surface antigen CD47-like isoform X3 n=1 Tax=Peromyscus maniculatus bairdii TaxID=230844 RepID=UPI001C2E8F72|nr:leukocyte surface antigen CD47-like isoform X3 [Peromyscus maniculatus bairdii]
MTGQGGMWPLVAVLLLSSLCCGSQLLFKNINSVTVSSCDKVVVIPCYVSNIETEDIKGLKLNWKFGNTVILIFEGSVNKYSKTDNFQSAWISPLALIKGNASLKLNKNEAKEGNYTCTVRESRREGKHTVELKYRRVRKYKSNPVNKKIILLSTSGLLLTIIVILGAILFIPGNYSKKKSYGLILFVTPSVIPIVLQYYKFKPAIGRTLHAMIIFTVLQASGFVLAMAGLYLTVNECVPKHGSLLVSGLVIIALVELFGLIYMKWLDPLIGFL